jgi:error-prone DNA polymerase
MKTQGHVRLRTRDMYVRDLHIDSIKVKTRDFR